MISNSYKEPTSRLLCKLFRHWIRCQLFYIQISLFVASMFNLQRLISLRIHLGLKFWGTKRKRFTKHAHYFSPGKQTNFQQLSHLHVSFTVLHPLSANEYYHRFSRGLSGKFYPPPSSFEKWKQKYPSRNLQQKFKIWGRFFSVIKIFFEPKLQLKHFFSRQFWKLCHWWWFFLNCNWTQ